MDFSYLENCLVWQVVVTAFLARFPTATAARSLGKPMSWVGAITRRQQPTYPLVDLTLPYDPLGWRHRKWMSLSLRLHSGGWP